MGTLEGCPGKVTLKPGLDVGVWKGKAGQAQSPWPAGGWLRHKLRKSEEGLRAGEERDRAHQRPRATKGLSPRGDALWRPQSRHSRLMDEENDNPIAIRDDKDALKDTRFYVTDLGTAGLG